MRQAFEQHRPSRVLIEGPRGFTHLLPELLHPDARQPLAIYAWARHTVPGRPDATAGAFVPFCDHSPELVAARLAADAGVPVEFCDLDHVAQVLGVAGPDPAHDEQPGETTVLVDEAHYGHSDALRDLARRMGCQDHDDLWELLVESTDVPLADHLARMVAYCLLARRDATPERLAADGTRAREAEMAHHVAAAVAARAPGDGPVLLVQGGFHAVALPDQLAGPTARPTVTVPARVETGAALVRYDFRRLDQLSGYASGMTSPGWHQRVWERTEGALSAVDARQESALAVLLDVADELRRVHRRTVPTPALAAAYEQALRLAALRERPAPLRSDVVDAVTSCFVQGDADTEGVLVQRVTLERLSGDAVGVLPPGASSPPLVRDTMERLRARRFDLEAVEPRTSALDVWRNPDHRRTSRVLHGLALLGVPFARHVAGPDFVAGTGLGRIQERWECLWTPLSEGALVEASRFGATLPEAVAVRFAQEVARATDEGTPSSRQAGSLLGQALVLGLHDRVATLLPVVRDALAGDPSFADVTAALGHLALLREGREPLEAHRVDGLDALVRTGYDRAIFLGREWQGEEVPPEEAVDALSRLRELLASPGAGDLDPEPFWALLDRLRTAHDLPLVRGTAAGLSHAAGRLDAESLRRDVVGHLAGSLPPETSVGFVRGLIGAAREVTWQEQDLLPGLDRLVGDWSEEVFLEHLPELRLAFSALTPAETDRVAAVVARLHGVADLGPLRSWDLAEDEVAAHLAASRRVADLLRGEGLGEWVS
ncbi:DUF5682 family protein [Nocardioides zeicaulis]